MIRMYRYFLRIQALKIKSGISSNSDSWNYQLVRYVCFSNLSVVKDVIFLLSFGSLDHRYGPKYLIECLPYLTVLKFGMLFSVLKLYSRDYKYVSQICRYPYDI